MKRTAKVVNTSRRVVLDGRGLVTLSGGGKRRILYQNTCDQRQTWTHLALRRPGHAAPGRAEPDLRRRRRHRRDLRRRRGRGDLRARRPAQDRRLDLHPQPLRSAGPDLGGGAVRALSQHRGGPVYVVGSTFTRGVCSNGAALSSIGVSWSIFNSVFTRNRAIGRGANPARPGTSGGGSGGAVYADGNGFRVLLAGTRMTGNHAREGGGAIFFVSNDRSGVLELRSSTLRDNPSDGFETDPGIFFLGRELLSG